MSSPREHEPSANTFATQSPTYGKSKVSWKSDASATSMVVAQAQPSTEMHGLEGVVANVNARFSKRRLSSVSGSAKSVQSNVDQETHATSSRISLVSMLASETKVVGTPSRTTPGSGRWLVTSRSDEEQGTPQTPLGNSIPPDNSRIQDPDDASASELNLDNIVNELKFRLENDTPDVSQRSRPFTRASQTTNVPNFVVPQLNREISRPSQPLSSQLGKEQLLMIERKRKAAQELKRKRELSRNSAQSQSQLHVSAVIAQNQSSKRVKPLGLISKQPSATYRSLPTTKVLQVTNESGMKHGKVNNCQSRGSNSNSHGLQQQQVSGAQTTSPLTYQGATPPTTTHSKPGESPHITPVNSHVANSTIDRTPNSQQAVAFSTPTMNNGSYTTPASVVRNVSVTQPSNSGMPVVHGTDSSVLKPAAAVVSQENNMKQLNAPYQTALQDDDDDIDFLEQACRLADLAENTRNEQHKVQAPRTIPSPPSERTMYPLEGSISSAVQGVYYARFKTCGVVKQNEQQTGEPKLVLHLVHPEFEIDAFAELCGFWASTPVRVHDYLNIVWDIPLDIKEIASSSTDKDGDCQIDPDDSDRMGSFAVDLRCQKRIIINNEQNYVVLCPDTLVSPTRIADARECLRRAVLSEKVPRNSPSLATVMGNAKHELIESALTKSIGKENLDFSAFTKAQLEEIAQSIVHDSSFVKDMFQVGTSEGHIRDSLIRMHESLRNWSTSQLIDQDNEQKHKHLVGQPVRPVIDSMGDSMEFGITNILAIEEKVVSPLWGLKGQFDVTVEGRFHPTYQNGTRKVGETVKAITPFEIKTGQRVKVDHLAQVAMYSLLASDRYNGMPVVGKSYPHNISGAIMHAATSTKPVEEQEPFEKRDPVSIIGVPHFRHELLHLIILRNAFAAALAASVVPTTCTTKGDSENSEQIAIEECTLPPVIGNRDYACQRCFSREVCMLYHGGAENGTHESSGLEQSLWESTLGHLSQEHLRYFSRWMRLLDFEFANSVTFQREIWTMSSKKREALGRCIGSLKLARQSSASDENGVTYVYEFVRIGGEDNPIMSSELQMTVGEYVALSVCGSQYMVGTGNIVSLSSYSVGVRTRKALPPFKQSSELLKWRIDKNEMAMRTNVIRTNVTRLFVGPCKVDEKGTVGDQRLRELVVDKRMPNFVHLKSEESIENLKSVQLPIEFLDGTHDIAAVQNDFEAQGNSTQPPPRPTEPFLTNQYKLLRDTFATLNPDQKLAVVAALGAKDYACIQGMPGTGKTTTIAFLIAALRALGQSVLFTSYTHNAVDNLLIKIKEFDVPFVRIGSASQVHTSVRDHTLGGSAHGYGSVLSVSSLENMVADKRLIVGATCLSVHNPIIQRKHFDYCIVDEAGQLTEPVVLGPMQHANVCIMVGDHQQLPPLVRDKRAKLGGMDCSLFKTFCDAYPNKFVKLTLQFRMNMEIMSVANTLVYQNLLQCGNDTVAQQRLQLPRYPSAVDTDWVRYVIDPSLPVVFVDTREVSQTSEERIGFNPKVSDDNALNSQTNHVPKGEIVNQGESRIVGAIVRGLIDSGLEPFDIGIIAPYRAQLRILRERVGGDSGIEIHTVDRFQGRDQKCIIVSLVRSNTSRDVGYLLQDIRRINVAFTRAKFKLIVVGSSSTIQDSSSLAKFVQLAEARNWKYTMHDHHFNTVVGQSPKK